MPDQAPPPEVRDIDTGAKHRASEVATDARPGGAERLWRLVLPASTLLLTVLVAGLAAVAGFTVADLAAGAYVFWPANAAVIALLMRVREERYTLVLIGFVAALVAASQVFGLTARETIAITFANLLEVAVVSMAMGRGQAERARSLPDERQIVGFLLVGLILGPAIGAAAAMVEFIQSSTSPPQSAFDWWAGHALASAIVIPLTLIPPRTWQTQLSESGRGAEAVILIGLATVLAVALFNRSLPFPTVFLLLPVLVLVAFRLGMFGVAAATAVVATVGLAAAVQGYGPLGGTGGSLATRMLFAQLFLAVAVATSVSIAALVEERRSILGRLQVAEERMKLVLEDAGGGLWDWDMVRGTIFYSDRWYSILGYERDEMGSSVDTWERLIHPEDRDIVRTALKDHVYGYEPASEAEYRLKAKDGRWIWIRDRGRIVEHDASGRPVRMVGTFSDRTEERTRLQRIAEVNARAEAAVAAKSRFMAAVTHELRTPLNAVIGFAELIETEAFGPIGSPRYKDFARDIRTSGRHLLELINDILDYAKAEAGLLRIQDDIVEIRPVVEEAVQSLMQRIERGGLNITMAFSPEVAALRADPRRIRQVLHNLIGNAIKYTRPGGRIDVNTTRTQEGRLRLTVSDTGVGIARQDLARVMELFSQLDGGLNRRMDGTGIGLPLTRQIVELHGGRFWLTSQRGVGTTAIAEFPGDRTIDAIAFDTMRKS